MRVESVPPRCVSVTAVFRRVASLSAGAGPPRRIANRLYRGRRSAAAERHVQLRLLGSAVDRHGRSCRRVVAHSPEEARSPIGGGYTCSLICRTRSACILPTFLSPGWIGGC